MVGVAQSQGKISHPHISNPSMKQFNTALLSFNLDEVQ